MALAGPGVEQLGARRRARATAMNPEPQEQTGLDDLWSLVADNRWLIILTTMIAVGASLFVSLRAVPQYEGTAKLAFSDPSSDVSLTGVPVAPTQQPAQVAAAGVAQVQRSGVLVRVARLFGDQPPGVSRQLPPLVRQQRFIDRLRDNLSVSVEPDSNLVAIKVRWPDALLAAQLANRVGEQTVELVTSQERRQYEARAGELKLRLDALPRSGPQTAAGASRKELQDQRSRLLALSTLARPVQQATRAEPAADPVSPRPVFLAVLSAVIGLLAGLLLAALRRAFDRRIRDVTDLERVLDLPTIGHFAVATLGIDAPMVRDHSSRGEMAADAGRVLRNNLGFVHVDAPHQVVVVTSGLEGEGKSTVAASLAVASAYAGDRTLLIDVDLRRPIVAHRFGIADEPGLSDYLARRVEPADVIRSIALPDLDRDAPGGLTVIPAGRGVPRPADLLESARFADFITEVREAYDLIVLDTAPLLPVPDTTALVPVSDMVLLCCRIDRVDRDVFVAARDALRRLRENGIATVATGITRRHAGRRGAYSYRDANYYYGYANHGEAKPRRRRERPGRRHGRGRWRWRRR
ncbi:Tyrosine-protein kinase EpsD [Patulibacter medicamentivorans]|uniref:non-specific protein-tyrosine kinase n=2 Tax=Patulibacter medicamentivorans TaxID=1097667 RepID=H0E7B2_9ACTN|nr:Tyrosine-protein kinase EpsD [Patulibacter medicamentivorans]